MNPGLVTVQSLLLGYNLWVKFSLEINQQVWASAFVSEEMGTVEENILKMAVGKETSGSQPGKFSL